MLDLIKHIFSNTDNSQTEDVLKANRDESKKFIDSVFDKICQIDNNDNFVWQEKITYIKYYKTDSDGLNIADGVYLSMNIDTFTDYFKNFSLREFKVLGRFIENELFDIDKLYIFNETNIKIGADCKFTYYIREFDVNRQQRIETTNIMRKYKQKNVIDKHNDIFSLFLFDY